VKLPVTGRYWNQLRREARSYSWKQTFLRMAADVVLVNVSLISAFALWFLFYVVVRRTPDPQALAERFKDFVTQYWFFWSLLAVLVFQLSGLYPRTRGTREVQKALVIFRAVSLFIVVFVFSDYFFFRGELVPRGVAVLGWFLMLIAVGGTRLTKHRILKLYNVELKSDPAKLKQVLVLGGAGYLGSVAVAQLLARGFSVRVLDSFLFGERSLDGIRAHPNVALIRGDVRDIGAVVQSMKGCDAVIHLAAIVGDPACDENKQLAVEVNRAATRMLVDVARGCGVRRFTFASSCSVYGASELLLDETSALNPLSVYAQTKVDSENILLAAKTESFAPTVLRFGTLFGLSPRMRFDLVVNLFVARAISAGRITLVNEDQWRPFLHVLDATRAMLACLEAPASAVAGEIFNVGSPSLNLSIADLGQAVARAIPNTEIVRIQNDDRRNYRVSFAKIERSLAFQCEKTLQSGIDEICEAIRSGAIDDFTTGEFNNQTAMRALAAKAGSSQPSSLRQLAALSRVESKPL
jgi:nucleoside-diphosphate-sugar epimerase